MTLFANLARLVPMAAPFIVSAVGELAFATPSPPRFGKQFSIRLQQWDDVLPNISGGLTDTGATPNPDYFVENWFEVFADLDKQEILFRALDFHMSQTVVHHKGDHVLYHQGLNAYVAANLPGIVVGDNKIIEEYHLDGTFKFSDRSIEITKDTIEQDLLDLEWAKRPKYCKFRKTPFPDQFDYGSANVDFVKPNAAGGGVWKLTSKSGEDVEVETNADGNLIVFNGQPVLSFSNSVPEGIFDPPEECTYAIDLDKVAKGEDVPDTIVYLQHAAWEQSASGKKRLQEIAAQLGDAGAELQDHVAGAELQDYSQFLVNNPFSTSYSQPSCTQNGCYGYMWKVKEKGQRLHGTLWCGWNNEFAAAASSQTMQSAGMFTHTVNSGYKIYSACSGEQYTYSSASFSGQWYESSWIGWNMEYSHEYPPTVGEVDISYAHDYNLLPKEIRSTGIFGMLKMPFSEGGTNGFLGDPGDTFFQVKWLAPSSAYKAHVWANSGLFAQRLSFCRAVPHHDSTFQSWYSPYAAFNYGSQATATIRYFGKQPNSQGEANDNNYNTDYEGNLELWDKLPFEVDNKVYFVYGHAWTYWSTWVTQNGQIIPDWIFDEVVLQGYKHEQNYYNKIFRSATASDQKFGDRGDSSSSKAYEVGGSDDKYCRHHDLCPFGNEQAEKSCFCDALMFMYVTRKYPLRLFAPTTDIILRGCYNLERVCKKYNWKLECTKFKWAWIRNQVTKYTMGSKSDNYMWGLAGRYDDTVSICATLHMPRQGEGDKSDPGYSWSEIHQIGNGWCDPTYNNDAYGYDGGDCCKETCRDPNRTITLLPNNCPAPSGFPSSLLAYATCVQNWTSNPNNWVINSYPGTCTSFDCQQPGCQRAVPATPEPTPAPTSAPTSAPTNAPYVPPAIPGWVWGNQAGTGDLPHEIIYEGSDEEFPKQSPPGWVWGDQAGTGDNPHEVISPPGWVFGGQAGVGDTPHEVIGQPDGPNDDGSKQAGSKCIQIETTSVLKAYEKTKTTVWSTNTSELENASTKPHERYTGAQYSHTAYYCPEFVSDNNGYTTDLTKCGVPTVYFEGSCNPNYYYVDGSYVKPKYLQKAAFFHNESGDVLIWYFCPAFVSSNNGWTTNIADCGISANPDGGSYGYPGHPQTPPSIETLPNDIFEESAPEVAELLITFVKKTIFFA